MRTYEGDLCCYDLKQIVKGEEFHIKKPTRFMTNSTYVGEALSEKCRGQHRHIELTGGGRTRRAEIYPDRLCRAILEGLVRQMQADGRTGCSFESDETNGKRNVMMEIDDDNSMDIDEVTWNPELVHEEIEEVRWSRSDYGTTRLMLPGTQGPKWSSCVRRITEDLDTGKVVEDRSVNEIRGRERRRVQRRR